MRTSATFMQKGRDSDSGLASDETLTPAGGPEDGGYEHSPTPLLTWRMFVMGVLVSMGGLIFGVCACLVR